MANQPNNGGAPPPQNPKPLVAPDESVLGRMVSEAIAKALTEALPMAAMMMAKVQSEAQHKAMQKTQIAHERCPECQQLVKVRIAEDGTTKKEFACKNEHDDIVVYPSNPEARRFFPGAFINGVGYKSNNSGHKVRVPKENAIIHCVENFERNEYEMNNPRQAFHDSGTISGTKGASGFIPAHVAWR